MPHTVVRRALSKCLWAAALLATAIFALAFTSEPARSQTFSTLYTFPGGSKGYGPSDIIVAPNGTIYGSAFYGVGCACNLVFSFADNKLTVLHRWSEPSGHNAADPQGLLLSGDSSVLFGTAAFGGPTNLNCFADAGDACGSVFAYNLTADKYKTLHNFTGTPDGMNPAGVQVLTPNSLYGVTWGGGTDGWGSFYRVSSTGEEGLYSFKNSADGQGPGGGLASYNGAYYGVTIGGGNTACPDGCGTIFKITPPGSETVLYSFTGGADGQNPYVLVGDGHGNFYGVSRNASNVVVAVFEINASGQFSIAYDGSFAAYMQWVAPGSNGTFYGVATGGNSSCQPSGCGQIFQLTPTGNGNGTIKILHQFEGPDGAIPQLGSLVLQNGALYGSTAIGGSTNQGTIFKIVP